nr:MULTISPECIES: leucine-rich repeat protein [unclassified Ruminococcus]
MLSLAVFPTAAAETYGGYRYTVLEDGTIEIADYFNADKEITVPSEINGRRVTSIGVSAFSSLKRLKSITIPSSVTKIGESAFYECPVLKSVTLPNSITSISDYAFSSCPSLQSITIPDSVTSIGSNTFYGCTALESITIPDRVTEIGGNAFFGCTALESIIVPESVVMLGSNAFSDTAWYNNQPNGVVYAGKVAYKYKGEMPENTEIVLKDGTKSIADNAFSGNGGLIGITMPDSVISIGFSSFSECYSLQQVKIGNNVTVIHAQAFYKCRSLTDVTISNSVTRIEENAFYDCSCLMRVMIPDSVTYIGEYAFAYGFSSPNYRRFIIYGYSGTAAETYATDNNINFESLGYCLKDDANGILVTTNNNADLVVEKLTDSESVNKANTAVGNAGEVAEIFDVTLQKNGIAVQPNGMATVKIPSDYVNAKVYRIEDDGSKTDMDAFYANGYLNFSTEHFSVYAVVVPNDVVLGDVTGDGKITIADAIMLQKHIANIVTISGDALIAADVDKSGSISIADAIMLQKHIANIVTIA